MKTVILTEGGSDIGFGHITRCFSLCQAFREKEINSQIMVKVEGSRRAVFDLLDGENYRIVNWHRRRNEFIKMINNAEIVIIDSYLAGKFLYDVFSELQGRTLVVIDDYNRLEYPRSVVVNPSIYGNTLNYSQKCGSFYLLGQDYIILRKEFWNVSEKKINKQIKNILITFGGINHSEIEHKIIDCLKREFNINFFAINPEKERFDAEDMINLMSEFDVCISAGGQTTYELARVGLPTIGICFADNQLLNLIAWAEKGFLEFVGWHNDKGLSKKVKESLFGLDYKKRLRMSRIGRQYVDGQGARRIVKVVLGYYEKN